MRRSVFGCVSILGIACAPIAISNAAEIKLVSQERAWSDNWVEPTPARCNIRITGQIAQGDAATFKQVADAGGAWQGGMIVCLNSPGGAYYEGLGIARSILQTPMATFVESEAICYSACSIIFMAGNRYRDGVTDPDRWLNVNGALGFHAPYIKGVPQQTYTNIDLETAYRESTRAIRDLANLGKEKRAVIIPPMILSELLGKGPKDLLLIDTVYKAAKANINLIGGVEPELNTTTLCNVCEMLHADPREFDLIIHQGVAAQRECNGEARKYGFMDMARNSLSTVSRKCRGRMDGDLRPT